MTEKKDNEKSQKEPQDLNIDLGLGGFLSGLGNLVEKLSELAEKGEELKKTGEFGEKELKGVYGFSVKEIGRASCRERV